MTTRSYVDFRFAPNWELIDPAREFLQRFFAIALKDDQIAGQVGLAAHELMENAIKYSPNDEARVRVEIKAGDSIRISVENDALEGHLPLLRAEVDAIRNAPDPHAHYYKRMAQALERTDGKSCLGLARIRAEAEMELELQVSGNAVRIIATRMLKAS